MKSLSRQQKEELKRLVFPHVEHLRRVAFSLSHNEALAEEFVAETIARACGSFSKLRDKSRVGPWLLRILSNLFISEYRAKTRHPHVEYVESSDEDDDRFSLFEELSQPFLLWWGNPERELIAKLVDEDIRVAIEALPPAFRVAVVLCDIEGHTYEEIAGILRIPIGTVRSRIARGRSLLQKKLHQHAVDAGLIKKGSYRHETENAFPQEH